MPNSRQNTDHVGLLEREESPSANHPEPAQAVAEPIQQKSRTPLGHHKTIIIAAAAAMVAIALGYFIHNAFLYEDTDDAQVEGHVMPLSSRINGQVLQVNVVQGQLVHAGDVLVVIDPKDYRVANQAAVKASQAVVAGAQQTLEQAQGKLLQARADLRNAQTAPQQVSMSNAKAKAAESQVMERKAKLEQAQLNLGYTIIRSPVNGIIGTALHIPAVTRRTLLQ